LPLTKTSKSKRGMIWADVTGDGLQDLLVAEPDSGQLSLNAQTAAGELGIVRRFPTFTGVTELQAGDWDGDGVTEIFLLSSDERQIGVTRYEAEGRIGFPTLLPVDGRPLAMAVGSLAADQPPVLAAVVERERRRELVVWGPAGEVRRQPLDEAFKANADALRLHDLDQDGRLDFVVLIPYEKLKVLRQKEDGSFDELDLAAPGGSSELPALSAGDVDNDGRPELLLAQKNFVRAVVLQPEAGGSDSSRSWSFRVKEQINGVSSASRITAATSVRLGAERTPALLLLDAERNAVSICQQDQAGVWQIARNVNLPVSDFTQLQPIRLGGNGTTAAAFLGLNAVAWLPFAGDAWELVELDDYETPIQDGFLHDVVSGDLNNDGRRDLVFLETGRHYLD
ncbi:MAG: VCBS repeat-containing protein, partial [Verrucomicrobiae bacterium]|nr:VCBS repeat-containing protein [Verrucomicrobiae bacterium]